MSAPRHTPLRLALFGHPVGHSRSAQLFAALADHGAPVEYTLCDVPPAGLAGQIEALRAGRWDGINVTVPHKEEVAKACDRLDRLAEAAGAVNVVRREPDGTLSGFNTDGLGLVDALSTHLPDALTQLERGGSALLLGDGGAARGVAAALRSLGAQIGVVGRDRQRTAARFGAALADQIWSWGEPAVVGAAHAAALVVQATTLGMREHDPLPPLPVTALRHGGAVVELIYNPWATAWLSAARARGVRGLNGWPMLVHQAARALTIWGASGAGSALIAASGGLEPRDPMR